MRSRILTVAVFVAALASLAAPAGADQMEADPGGNEQSVSIGKITFGSSPTIQCDVTLLMDRSSMLDLTVSEYFGSLDEFLWNRCSGGSIATAIITSSSVNIREINDEIFGDTLDDVESLGLTVDSFDIRYLIFGGFVNCEYRGDAGMFLELFDTGTNTYTDGSLIFDESVQLPQIGGSELCPDETEIQGTIVLLDQSLVTT